MEYVDINKVKRYGNFQTSYSDVYSCHADDKRLQFLLIYFSLLWVSPLFYFSHVYLAISFGQDIFIVRLFLYILFLTP